MAPEHLATALPALSSQGKGQINRLIVPQLGDPDPWEHGRFGTGFSGAFRDPEVRLESQIEISAGWTLLHGFGDRFWLCGAFTNTATKDTTYNSQCSPLHIHTPSTLGLSKRPEAAGTDLERH